jgi:hypothetical protein
MNERAWQPSLLVWPEHLGRSSTYPMAMIRIMPEHSIIEMKGFWVKTRIENARGRAPDHWASYFKCDNVCYFL